MCYFSVSPPQAGLKQREFFIWRRPIVLTKCIIALTFEKEDNMKETEALRKLCDTIIVIGIVLQSCVMNALVPFILSSFSKRGQLCCCQHSWFNGTLSDEEKFPLLQACLRGKSSTFWKWHCLRKIALESKHPIHTWVNLVSNYLEKEYSIQHSKNQWYSIKNVVEINRSKSLHSFLGHPV